MNVFKVVSGQLFHIIQEEINTGSKNFFKVQFVFDNSWEEYDKLRFAEFYQDINSTHYKIAINEEGIVNVPTEIICSHLPLYVGVSAENQNGENIANTDFKSIKVNYGANTNKEKIIYPESEENYYALFSPNTKLRYLRIEKGVLEYSSDNKTWDKVSSAISSGGLTKEEVEEIVTEATKDLPKDIDASANEENFILTVELKDKNGNVVSTKNIDLSFLETDLTEHVKFTDYAGKNTYGLVKDSTAQGATVQNGMILIIPRSENEIKSRVFYGAITPKNLDFAVKEGIANNTQTLTDEEKTSACEWLGAVKKPKTIAGLDSVITQTPNGEIASIALAEYANQALYGRIPRYQNPAWENDKHTDNMGMLVTNNPTKKYHCANKGWVEDYVNSLKTYRIKLFLTGNYYTLIQKHSTVPTTAGEVFSKYSTKEGDFYLPSGCYFYDASKETRHEIYKISRSLFTSLVTPVYKYSFYDENNILILELTTAVANSMTINEIQEITM